MLNQSRRLYIGTHSHYGVASQTINMKMDADTMPIIPEPIGKLYLGWWWDIS